MFCPTCGAKLPDGSVFCEKCGARVARTSEPPKKVVLDPKEVVEHKPEKDSSKTFAGNGRSGLSSARTVTCKPVRSLRNRSTH